MKCEKKNFRVIFLLVGLLMQAATCQTWANYVNDGVVLCPPQIPPNIDDASFANSNKFIVNFTNGLPSLPPTITPAAYETQNTLNYTNGIAGFMSCNMGFRMESFLTSISQRKQASSLFNAGTINCGTVDTTNLFTGAVKFLVNATNIENSGNINMGFESLLNMKGRSINLDRANITMETSGFNLVSGLSFFNAGIFDGYWGSGETNSTPRAISPLAWFGTQPPITPPHFITNRNQSVESLHQLILQNSTAYVSDTFADQSNRVVRVVFISNTNSEYNINVYLPQNLPAYVEWTAKVTNSVGVVSNKYLYLQDTFGVSTNRFLVINGVINPYLVPYSYTFQPVNYTFFRGGPLALGTATPAGLPANTFTATLVTNQYTAYRAIFQATSRLPADVAGQNVTNMPGRLEIVADDNLNLSRAKISSQNYLLLKATNHVVSTSRAQISSPWSDINLRSTNGLLTISNNMTATVSMDEGTIDLWSGRWTNVTFQGGFVTNSYHVLFVDSRASAYVPTRIKDLTLRCTNVAGGSDAVVIGDALNVTEKFLIESQRITVTTNLQTFPTPRGELNLLSSAITWSSATPRLQCLTNFGKIQALNAVFFGGARTSQYYGSNFNEPYLSFVNRGLVATDGSLIWANYFENTGFFNSGNGPGSFTLAAQDARLTNGSIAAVSGDLSIVTGNLIVTNHLLQAGHTLSFTVTNSISDTGGSNANSWVVGSSANTTGIGLNMNTKPVTGDLLGTTITELATAGKTASHVWAGQDRGADASGYTNNVAVGRLIFDGGDDSVFTFTGTGVSNAIYIDYLELKNFATNIDLSGNVPALAMDTNIIVYYAQAVAGNISVAERLDQANGGRLRWVWNYHTGIYSSTNLVYPDGTTNSFNTALVQSKQIDSDGDGSLNADDPSPIFRPQDIALTVAMANQPSIGAKISWNVIPDSTSTVYYKSATSASTNWLVLTNVAAGPFGTGRTTVFDPISPSGGRYYRVKINLPQP